MNQGIDSKKSVRKTANSAIERVGLLEVQLSEVVEQVNVALDQNSQRLSQMALLTEALVELLGSEAVDEKLKELMARKEAQRKLEATARMETAKSKLEEMLANGLIEAAPVIGDDPATIVVGREFEASGELIHPGRAQISMASVDPTIAPQLKGNGAGFKLTTPRGNTFEVLEVYVLTEKGRQPPAPETAPVAPPATETATPATQG